MSVPLSPIINKEVIPYWLIISAAGLTLKSVHVEKPLFFDTVFTSVTFKYFSLRGHAIDLVVRPAAIRKESPFDHKWEYTLQYENIEQAIITKATDLKDASVASIVQDLDDFVYLVNAIDEAKGKLHLAKQELRNV